MLPLENIRILDFTHLPPGQFCTMMLSDMGAKVLRVEQPQKSDAYSALVPAYKAFNRNKRSIGLNLRSEEARQVVYKIVEKMDVVVEGFRPGVAKRLGIDYQTLGKINPRVIYCSMTGYGQEGPYRDVPGHDINYIAIGGALSMFGDPPLIMPNLIGDYAGGTLHAVIGILTALIAREKTYRGQYVDIAFTDGVVSLLTHFAYEYFASGAISLQGPWAAYGAYKTKDGEYITVGCFEPWFWENLCRALGREDFVPYQYAQSEKQEEIRSCFSEIFLTKTREEWFDLLRGMNIPVGKVYWIDEVFTDPQVLHRQMLVEVEDSKGGKERQVGIPIKLTDTPGRIRSTAPIPGQHTEQVLLELGYTKEEVEELCKKGAIFLP